MEAERGRVRGNRNGDDTIMNYYIGQSAKVLKVISRELIEDFSKLSGDYNPVHLKEDYAKEQGFTTCIAHGMIGGALLSAVIGTEFPGQGTIYLSQNLTFCKPIYVGETIRICVEIIDLSDNNRARLSTVIRKEDGEEAVVGEACVKLPAVRPVEK